MLEMMCQLCLAAHVCVIPASNTLSPAQVGHWTLLFLILSTLTTRTFVFEFEFVSLILSNTRVELMIRLRRGKYATSYYTCVGNETVLLSVILVRCNDCVHALNLSVLQCPALVCSGYNYSVPSISYSVQPNIVSSKSSVLVWMTIVWDLQSESQSHDGTMPRCHSGTVTRWHDGTVASWHDPVTFNHIRSMSVILLQSASLAANEALPGRPHNRETILFSSNHKPLLSPTPRPQPRELKTWHQFEKLLFALTVAMRASRPLLQ